MRKTSVKRIVRKLVNKCGIKLERMDKIEEAIKTDKDFMEIYEQCKDYSMNTVPALYQLWKSVIYIIENNIPGDFVECGVLRGGNIRLIALTLQSMGITSRNIWVYDTFEGMEGFSEEDKIVGGANPIILNKKELESLTCSIEEVKENVYSTDYPQRNFIFVKGDVEKTLKDTTPRQVSLLRLDTDYYRSTLAGLKYLYPLVTSNGVVIFDDYGTFAGSKKAVDDYFEDVPILLMHIDHTTRLMLKLDCYEKNGK